MKNYVYSTTFVLLLICGVTKVSGQSSRMENYLTTMENAAYYMDCDLAVTTVNKILELDNIGHKELIRINAAGTYCDNIAKIVNSLKKSRGRGATTGKITITNIEKNPYNIYIDGKYVGQVPAYTEQDYTLDVWKWHEIKALQVSGYTFYPTEFNKTISVDILEVETLVIDD